MNNKIRLFPENYETELKYSLICVQIIRIFLSFLPLLITLLSDTNKTKIHFRTHIISRTFLPNICLSRMRPFVLSPTRWGARSSFKRNSIPKSFLISFPILRVKGSRKKFQFYPEKKKSLIWFSSVEIKKFKLLKILRTDIIFSAV